MNHRITATILLVLAFGLQTARAQQPGLDTPLPIDPTVRIGRLDNGLSYYIRQNHRPEKRAEVYLAVNVGAVQEDDDQQGLAHFTEHMAFNGTRKYAKQQLIDLLESFGMRLGPSLNAGTGYDQTVYMLHLPADSTALGLDVLREWATSLTMENEEIDKERGVIVEEWRLYRGASARISDKQDPVIFKGSKYAVRNIIGDLDGLRTFPYDAVKRFYHDWYRPELMAVIAVGDFDPVLVEARIKELFSSVPATSGARTREQYQIPDHDETLVTIVSDKEAPYGQIGVLFKHPLRDYQTVGEYRQRLAERLYNTMFNARLSELTQAAEPPFIQAASYNGRLGRTKEVYQLQAIVRGSGFVPALETLLTEAERVRQHGFTPGELDRQKTALLRQLEQQYAERDKTESRMLLNQYIGHFLTQSPIPGIEWEYATAQKLIPGITLEEINEIGKRWIIDRNRVITASGPEKEGTVMPAEAELLAVFDRVATTQIEPYVDRVSAEPLVARVPKAGSIVREQTDPKLGTTTLMLSNGARGILKPTDFKADEVLFAAYSNGGSSLVADPLLTPAQYAASIMNESGVGTFNAIDLRKKLTGKMVRVSPFVSAYSEGLNGQASPKDLETMLQLVHLYFTAPRADSIAFVSYKKRMGELNLSYQKDPGQAFSDSLQVTMANHHPRRKVFSQQTLDEMDMARSLEIFRQRFADGDDFTFLFIGAIDPATLKPLIATYLGSLPRLSGRETWKDEGIRPPKGVVERTVYKGQEPKSQVAMVFTGSFDWNIDNRRQLEYMIDVLNIQLREMLREEMGGTYGVSVYGGGSHIPYDNYQVRIQWGCDPARVEEMTKAVFARIDSLRAFGAPEKYLTKVREATLRSYEENMKENRYWMSQLQSAVSNDEYPEILRDGPKPYLDHLTPESVREAARKYLDPENYVRMVLLPEGMKVSTKN